MASIFTFDDDSPRVSSPWLTPLDTAETQMRDSTRRPTPYLSKSLPGTPPPGLLSDYRVTKLGPEPQTGPAEYKLHLLLRPRRTYSSSSTGLLVTGSQKSGGRPLPTLPVSMTASSNQSRQYRLQQLTTQLLWRLQQSSPYHASSGAELVLPQLSETGTSYSGPARPEKLLAGLEASRGALYEIGVSDDGTLVGLTEDEMEESLVNLKSMASSLGCTVEVTRMVLVGDCEWLQPEPDTDSLVIKSHDGKMLKSADKDPHKLRRKANLYVAEALVTPDLRSAKNSVATDFGKSQHTKSVGELPSIPSIEGLDVHKSILETEISTEQLRITLTGPTTSGKSSLLGTLTTGTLDNGRGKSRMSLLKHRHELASGITSSVAQELLGYRPTSAPGSGTSVEVINYASGDVSSWTDIHAFTENGRMVFVSDSAGHPRYRRTTVKGLVGWAPHWTVLCIAADNADTVRDANVSGGTSSAQDVLGAAGIGVDLAKAHLELCLKLERPLAIVITKLDLASRMGLRQTMATILSAIKAAGRIPAMIPPENDTTSTSTQPSLGDNSKQKDLSSVSNIIECDRADAVQKILNDALIKHQRSTGQFLSTQSVAEDLNSIVPIVMTSARTGAGISNLHAMLLQLPLPPTPSAQDYTGEVLNPEQPSCLFHIEDTFALPASFSMQTSASNAQIEAGTVVAGYQRFGSLSVGDHIVLGPFPTDIDASESPQFQNQQSGQHKPQVLESHVQSDANISTNSFRYNSLPHPSLSDPAGFISRSRRQILPTMGEWYNAHIVSIRNLRLPVHRLDAGQVGTIGIIFDLDDEEVSNGPFERPPPCAPRIRKGMVLAVPSRHMIQTGLSLQAANGFTASFDDEDVNSITPGSLLVVYVASIRASARVIRVAPHVSFSDSLAESDGVFDIDETLEKEIEQEPAIFGSDGVTDVTFELMTNREWIELGSQVLIMPGGGSGGLEAFAGSVIEVAE